MDSSEQFDESILHSFEHKLHFEAQAKDQWALLNALELEYYGKTVYGTKGKFEDKVWFDERGLTDQKRIYWNTFVGESNKALLILVKVVFFDLIVTHRLESSTVVFKLYALKNSIIELILKKHLLAVSNGDYSLGLNHITDDDLLAMLDSLLVSTSSESKFAQQCSEIAQFISFTNHFAESAPFLEICAKLPWIKAGLGIKTWVKIRAADLGETFRTGDGYAPLVPECAMPLIQKSLYLVLEHGNHFAELALMLRGYKWNQVYSGPPIKELLNKYAAILGDVEEPPDIAGLSSTIQKISAVFIWFRRLLYLARAACVNIILLTSGLRNSDIRGLKVGACTPSGRIDMLFYLRANIKKTKNILLIPVPTQTENAVRLLEKLKFSESDYLIDATLFTNKTYDLSLNEEEVRVSVGDTLNKMIRDFADHFNIPFIAQNTDKPYSAHNYRTTVAGWLDAHSNLSVLMVRRLFGHSNDVMPTTYLRNNPSFIQERKEQKERAAAETARQMAMAASQGRLAGIKGEQLIRGYQTHVSRLQSDPKKSHSLTDAELFLSFTQLIEQRILNESVCGFLTPFGVRCMRNPSDSSQPPCARRSHRDKTREIAEDVLLHISDIAPQNCIGTSCDQALLGPWSKSILETLLWHADLLHHKYGDKFTDEHFRLHAISFIRQYGPLINKVFQIEVLPDGSVRHGKKL
ncbi:tyrosine-type recombinase/integrase [Methylotenera mobilis]|jgi:integrase|uniref:tyrosine-type recombinase/integrase n=1 Tax=Methylotenera mobilis TaxID=359408 RepID=UPI00037074B1|nr:tyrosine-type recombinase/integrase [Methylotenera mobilis]